MDRGRGIHGRLSRTDHYAAGCEAAPQHEPGYHQEHVRRGAVELLHAVSPHNAIVVTNSGTGPVGDSILHLFAGIGEGDLAVRWKAHRVYGEAKKFDDGDEPSEIKEQVCIPGLARPIFLRRSHYFDVVNRKRLAAGAEWSEVVIFGDNLELDLIMFWYLGATIVLITHKHTPQYEIDFVQSHERCHLVHTLPQAQEILLTAA